MGITSFINDMSSELIYVLLPYKVRNEALVGLLGGLFNGLGSVTKVLFGYLSDKWGKRKPQVILGYLVSSVSKTLIALSSVLLLPLWVVLDRVGKGIRDAPRDALLGKMKERGRAFGIHRAMDTLGALTGSLLALFLFSLLPLDLILLLAGLVSFLSLVPLFFLPEPGSSVRKGFKGGLGFVLPALLLGSASISPMIFISELSDLGIGLYVLYNLFYALSAYFLGKRADRMGYRRVVVLGGILLSLSLLLLYGGSPLSLPLYGVALGALIPSTMARVSSTATGAGAFQTVYGLAILGSSTAVGYLRSLGFPVYPVLSILGLAGALVWR